MPSRKRHGAFSVVEILIVISIIVILISLLVPSLGAARESSRRYLCMKNQQQLHVAFENYANDRKGVMCRSVYLGHLKQYIDDTKYHFKGCPSWGEVEFAYASGWYGRSIGINTITTGSWTWSSVVLKKTHVTRPSVTFNTADSSGTEVGDANLIVTEERTLLRGRHKKAGLNFLFLDGHSEFLRPGSTVAAAEPFLPNAQWRYYPNGVSTSDASSCAGPGNATAPFRCIYKGCFWHVY